jgi:hypothetical protein
MQRKSLRIHIGHLEEHILSRKSDKSGFLKRRERGRRFERWERTQWNEEIESEVATKWKGKRGRIDIRIVDEEEGISIVVELKATNWDMVAAHRIRPNVLRHARQIWRYIDTELNDNIDVVPALVYPSSPCSDVQK